MLEVQPRRRAGFAGTRPVYAFPLRYDRQKLRLWLAGVVLPAAPSALGVRTLYSIPASDLSGRTTAKLFPWCWVQTGTAYSPNNLLPPGLTLAGAALLALVWSAIAGQRDLKSKAVARSTGEAAAVQPTQRYPEAAIRQLFPGLAAGLALALPSGTVTNVVATCICSGVYAANWAACRSLGVAVLVAYERLRINGQIAGACTHVLGITLAAMSGQFGKNLSRSLRS